MKCHNCNNNALYLIENSKIPLCLNCYIRLEDINLRQIEAYQREINYLNAEMDDIFGFPGSSPKYLEKRKIIHTGGVTLNNIHVTNSEIGVLNTGNIKNVDTSVTVIKSEINKELASILTELSEAIIKSCELETRKKDEIFEILSILSAEAIAPKEKQKKAVVSVLISKISEIVCSIAAIDQIWGKAETIFKQIFGF